MLLILTMSLSCLHTNSFDQSVWAGINGAIRKKLKSNVSLPKTYINNCEKKDYNKCINIKAG